MREAVVRLHPRLVVCGHIHGCAGQHEILGSSPVVNAGPEGIEWRLDADVSSRAPEGPDVRGR